MCIGARRHRHPCCPRRFEETPRQGQLPFEQRGNDNLNRANHSDEYKHRQ